MGGFLLFLFILAIVVFSNLVKKTDVGAGSRRRRLPGQAGWNLQQARRRLQSGRGGQSPSGATGSWPAPNIPAAVPTRSASSTPPRSPAERTTAQSWRAAWAPDRAPSLQPVASSGAGDVHVRHDSAPRAFGSEPGEDPPSEPATEPMSVPMSAPLSDPLPAGVLSESPSARYVGSAALESTLDSTIESSLLGVPDSPTMSALATGGRRTDLDPEVEAQVAAFVADGHEVAAVRLICDTTQCGIMDAMRTVESRRTSLVTKRR